MLETRAVPIGAAEAAVGVGGRSSVCRVRLEVMAETSSGGHKFKVSQVTVRWPLHP